MPRECATMTHHFALVETDPVYNTNRRAIERHSETARLAARVNVIRIPVVVHVIYRVARENLDEAQIESQIDALNRDYRFRNADASSIPAAFRNLAADPLIEFGLAVRDPSGNATTGITRTRTSIREFPYRSNDPDAIRKLDEMVKHDEHGKSAWPRDEYLNLWVCTIQGGLLGYAQFPGGPAATDGVVINNNAFGTRGTAQAPFNDGRTGVHEVGHWLNLLHIWGDDRGGCDGSDNIGDTPNQAGSNTGKPKFPHVSCNNGPDGDLFMNYMDYVDDAAMVMFTHGQVRRMNAALSGPRASLASSKGLLPVETEPIYEALGGGGRAGFALGSESGDRTEKVFDGVDWV